MNVYLDTSVLLRHLLRQPQAIPSWGSWKAAYSSVLLKIESLRTLDRLRLQEFINDEQRMILSLQLNEVLKSLFLVPLQESILERALAPFPTVISTLDAIHLSTAILLQKEKEPDLTILTHDTQLSTASRSLNFKVLGD